MRAVAHFKDERAIEKLEWTAANGKSEHSRCYAAKILFDLIGYDKYFEKLNAVFDSDNSYSKASLGFWIKGLEEERALKYFWKAMNDSGSFVRYSAYGALENYYGIRMLRKDDSEIKYFTDEEVYQDKERFHKRQKELKKKIRKWKKD